jgi:hypothetical protein
MGTQNKLWLHIVSWSLLICGFSIVALSAYAQETSEDVHLVADLPESPGATLVVLKQTLTHGNSFAQLGAPVSTQLLPTQSQGILPILTQADQPRQFSQAQVQSAPQSSQAQQPPAQRPVGTAAAGSVPVSGIAASQPSGVAIAPAKQRRVRTIVLKVGAIVAAGVAVGSVIALTEATSSKPPGAH